MNRPKSAKGKSPALDQEPPTTPPRISFGVELEFLIAQPKSSEDPDEAVAHLLPPLGEAPVDQQVNEREFALLVKVKRCLQEEGVPVNAVMELDGVAENALCELNQGTCANPLDAWTVMSDCSVKENGDPRYHWTAVELSSPASYAFDEAFDMIRLVISIVTTSFRCRVNASCGLHVHVGNGPYRMTLRAARSFAALWWATEPLLAMLHPPERVFGMYAASSRQTLSQLSSGKGAEDVRLDVPESRADRRRCRFFGRDRQLGEETEARRRLRTDGGWSLEDEADGVDWEADGAEPFGRPRKMSGAEPSQQVDLVRPLQYEGGAVPSIKRGPPEIFDGTLWRCQDSRHGDDHDESASVKEDESWRYLPRPQSPPLARLGGSNPTRYGSHRPIEALDDPEILRRLAENDGNTALKAVLCPEKVRPGRSDRAAGWSGVRELLSCDAGLHQIERLMSSASNPKFMSLSWSDYRGHVMGPEKDGDDDEGAMRRARVTVESRGGQGSLDGEWVTTWARIVCRVAEFARDADPAQLMRVIGLCNSATRRDEAAAAGGREAAEYDVVDFLNDIGLPREARVCEERLARGSEAYFECRLLQSEEGRKAWRLIQEARGARDGAVQVNEVRDFEDELCRIYEEGERRRYGAEGDWDEDMDADGRSGGSGESKKRLSEQRLRDNFG